MCSLQSASVANIGSYPSEHLEDDFITNLFSQNIESNHDDPQITSYSTISNQNVVPSDYTWLSSHQMDHDYVAETQPSPVLLSAPLSTTTKTSLNMSTYFSTFDPSIMLQTNQPSALVMHNKLNNGRHVMEKIHRARINVISAGTGNFKAIVKRKRKRTVFRTDQVEAMEEVFAKKPYVTKEDRQVLVNRLNISDKSIKVWFQNRRLKNKRGDDYQSDDENRSSPNLDRLNYVESKIHERTNEFGYVTLDDKIMSDLVNVIDEYLCKPNVDSSRKDIVMEETVVKNEIVYMYEPISPASTVENSNEESLWEYQSPIENEYLQRLIDIESIISS